MQHKTAQELGIHLPPLSFYPILVSVGLACIPLGIIQNHYSPESVRGEYILLFGIFFLCFSLMGWAWEVIKDKNDAHSESDVAQQQSDLGMVTKLILVSEGAVFFSLFAHYFYHDLYFIKNGVSTVFDLRYMRPEGVLETTIPALATMLLMASSFTCHLAHHALIHGNKAKSKTWLLYTIALGLIFLGMQGHEWGYLHGLKEPFTASTSMFGTSFYLMTGFHGAHVALGLVMLFLVYSRLEMGHMTEKRHFSMLAASWYWHFVDIIWIILFFTIYLI
jgi:cytochrome c oxidase subunit 3